MKKIILAACMAATLPTFAQQDGGVTFSGSIQSDMLVFPENDKEIGTNYGTNKDFLTNTYANFNLQSKFINAGARLEYMENPLPGFENNFAGWGLPYLYVQGNYKSAELTLGDFYEQFGSGLVLRAYEERALGIDNSIRGGRLVLRPINGLNIKVLGGQQREYWENRDFDNFKYIDSNNPWIYGADVEVNVDNFISSLGNNNTSLLLGFSAVTKHEQDENLISIQNGTAYRLNLPENVTAFDVRANLQKGNYNFLAEYAWKTHDPSSSNDYIYRMGNTLLLSGSYSKKGFSALLQAKRTEDMSFRSKRSMDKASTARYINHLPAFSTQHTYALAALYPYATQNALGEWAFQGEVGYNFKRNTALGGKYGTKVKLNASHIRGIDRRPLAGQTTTQGTAMMGTDGYNSKFFEMGNETYYQDINLQVEKKLTKDFKLNLMYMNQRYNQFVIEGHGDTFTSNIFIAEGKWNISKKVALRAEAQYLTTSGDQHDWAYGLLELSVLPGFMFTVSDMYNANVKGSDGLTSAQHFYNVGGAYTYKAHRLQLSYGKTRAGFNCSGGVCRYVPASKGFNVSYNFNF
ncbi:MAG: hypothetical protein II200_02105 [Bacteroidaceae bacterium]|nr:hypothetical protein [Bacteroidaceae bacterium]